MSEEKKVRQFAYIGDHDETNVFGVTFVQGEPTAVADQKAAAKLAANADFTEVVDGAEIMPARRKPGRPRRDLA